MTFGAASNTAKAHIKMALAGKLPCGETETGFEYADAAKVECDRFILESFDSLVFEAKQGLDTGRALERVLLSFGIKPEQYFTEFMKFLSEERQKYNDYNYESDETEE